LSTNKNHPEKEFTRMRDKNDKPTITRRLKEKICADVKNSKQTTLDNQREPQIINNAKMIASERRKSLEITEIGSSTREDELVLKVAFKLHPSKASFSKLTSDLCFDNEKIDSLRLQIPLGPLASDDSEFSSVLDMTGIGKGKHTVKVDLYELWSSGEKLTLASKEATIDYVPVKREDRLVRVPIVKRVAGADLAIVSDAEKNIYRQIGKTMKKEQRSKRDPW
jgi:hypothetical protein